MAVFRGAREVQRLGYSKKIADLVHLHGGVPPEILNNSYLWHRSTSIAKPYGHGSQMAFPLGPAVAQHAIEREALSTETMISQRGHSHEHSRDAKPNRCGPRTDR